ncbi:MAG TPA: CehA/McbA family metallohydrolase [Bryobacteraceae bacterium]|nr:CehA/McbA family metallohydrolase [Bryobacteraceae bacterium]HPU70585.1 CehA/McbA family metallohydrolase [Bryobacteraceae bacterium]
MARERRLILLRSAGMCALIALIAHAAVQSPARFVGRIVDDETGQPVAARIVVTDAQGRPVEIAGKHDHVQYLQKRWCYVDGRFEAPGSGQGLKVEIWRGLETIPLEQTVTSSAGEQTFRLRRWINTREQGYMNGDTHVHYLALDQCHLQMRAEDLEVLNLLTSDFTNDREKFTGKLATVSTPGSWVWVGQEFRDWQQGHLNLLRLQHLIEPFQPAGGVFRSTSERHLLLTPAAKQARAQGGTVTWAHFGDMPGAESPIAIAMGVIDALDMLTSCDPLVVGTHWEPWGMTVVTGREVRREPLMDQPADLPRLPALTAIDRYYQFLNAGFRIPLASGTDKMGDDIPVGSSRVYVKAPGERSFDAWLAGLKAGTGFITNGPIMTFEVDGHGPGEVVNFSGSRTVTARAAARSILPFGRLQIVVNGEAVASSGEPSRDKSGVYEVKLEAKIPLKASSWLAARVAEPSRQGKTIMPRRMTVFAHTNPVYFLRDGVKVRVQKAIDYLRLYLRYSERWFQTGAKFDSEATKQQALEQVKWAVDYYSKL